MKLFDVYPLFDITPVTAEGCYVWDDAGNRYLDLYGGHAVISIGHSHPVYVSKISEQLQQIGFYSNSVKIPQQQELADKLGQLSGLDDYQLFLCNSGAEANENALKLASFATGRKKVISFKRGFHGRTSAVVSVTDNPRIIAPLNETDNAVILPLNDIKTVEAHLKAEDVAAVIIEGIQGIGGIHVPDPDFLERLSVLCKRYGSLLVLDEIQSGYGRSGKFFAFQYTNVRPDIIAMAKVVNAQNVGDFLLEELSGISGVKEIRGKGLMIGIEFEEEVKPIRQKLLFEEKIFTGVSGAHIIRLLPPLSLTVEQVSYFIEKFEKVLSELRVHSNEID